LIAPLTVKVQLELTTRLPVAVPEVELEKETELDVVLTVTVTVAPAAIMASSVVSGTTPPDQVVVAFQFPPVTVLVMVAASTEYSGRIVKAKQISVV